MKSLANEFPALHKKLKQHKSNQHNSVMKESDHLKKVGLSEFVKKIEQITNDVLLTSPNDFKGALEFLTRLQND